MDDGPIFDLVATQSGTFGISPEKFLEGVQQTAVDEIEADVHPQYVPHLLDVERVDVRVEPLADATHGRDGLVIEEAQPLRNGRHVGRSQLVPAAVHLFVCHRDEVFRAFRGVTQNLW